MASQLLREPLLLNKDKQGCAVAFRRAAACGILVFIWIAFLSWIGVFAIFPTISLLGARHSASSKSSSSLGLNGLILLAFGAPLALFTLLATLYLQIRPTVVHKKRTRPRLSLWTYPVLVDGLLGVVSAAELLFIFAAVAYLVWAMTNFGIKDSVLINKFMEFPLIQDMFASWQLWLYVLGLSIGFLGLVCMSFLFIPVSRGSPLLRLIDIPFEHAVKYHVWLGHLTMAVFTIHGLCYVIVWASQGRLLEELFAWQKIGVANLPGVISLVAGIFLWVTSFGFVRFRFFELFFYTHQLYIVFVVFMAFHIGDTAFCICVTGILLYMLDRFLRFCQSRRGVEILSWRVLSCGTIEVLLPKPRSLNYNSLSFIFLNVPRVSCLEWHPFSVSSSPYDATDSMSFLVKPLGSWTEELQKVVESNVQKGKCPLLGVEGPYGHESDYYLQYQALVLVAGGIGISPFIAILRDLLQRHNMNHDNLPTEVTIVWAVKSSKELSLINMINPESLCPGYAHRLKLTVQAYVTRESQPDPENYPPGPEHILKAFSKVPPPSSSTKVSTLVGTYSNIWVAFYLLVSIAGTLLVQGMMQKYYLGELSFPKEGGSRVDHHASWADSWTVRAAALLLSMVIGTVLFGGLVLFCWNWIESSRREKEYPSPLCSSPATTESSDEEENFNGALVGPSNTCYGQRPDLKELFVGFAKKWRGLNVGVLLCGPSTLQASVANECRLHNTRRFKSSCPGEAVFHYHSVSFDL